MRFSLLLICVVVVTSRAQAWGKRGHETVGSLAAQLVAKELPQGRFLSNHSFDMGFYNNAPDLVWKADPDTYKKEFPQHFLDLELFDRAFAKAAQSAAPVTAAPPKNIGTDGSSGEITRAAQWNPSRIEFFKTFPDLDEKAGRAPWRIQELCLRLDKIVQDLKKKNLSKKEHHQLQEKWLLTAGILGHYIADLAQPMHVTENYDGQLTKQKGLHHWFEENIVDDLYPSATDEVYKKAQAQWKTFYQAHQKMTAFDLSLELVKDSHKNLKRVLDLDKKLGRASERKVSGEYRELVIERLSTGVLFLATIWSQHLDWPYNGDKFFNFVAKPDYIEPGT